MGQQVADLLIQEVGPVPQLSQGPKDLNPELVEALQITKGVLLGAVEAEGLDPVPPAGTVGLVKAVGDLDFDALVFQHRTAGATIVDGLGRLQRAADHGCGTAGQERGQEQQQEGAQAPVSRARGRQGERHRSTR